MAATGDPTAELLYLRSRLAELTAIRAAERLALERTREHFRRDLHDGLQQTIAAARMDLDGLRDLATSAEARAAVAELGGKLTLALRQVHGLSSGADPPELRFGLKPAIDRTLAHLRLDGECRVTGSDLGGLTLPVYHIVRESLTNVYKHARARTVQVDVALGGNAIDVAVRDDGVGGATEPAAGGIRGMRDRVGELGGTFELCSHPGAGTLVGATIPLLAS
ncbi:MAG TPA: ATP-binding protein [Pseudonocardia sp.]|jgi:signal transduction histidine kinase